MEKYGRNLHAHFGDKLLERLYKRDVTSSLHIFLFAVVFLSIFTLAFIDTRKNLRKRRSLFCRIWPDCEKRLRIRVESITRIRNRLRTSKKRIRIRTSRRIPAWLYVCLHIFSPAYACSLNVSLPTVRSSEAIIEYVLLYYYELKKYSIFGWLKILNSS